MDRSARSGPAWRNLFHGAVRESLAHVNSTARIGTQETHAWEKPISYVSDDNQGNVGVVEFQVDGAIGAVSARAPGRPLDCAQAIRVSPAGWWRDGLTRLCELPLLKEGLGVSAVFWTVGDSIEGPENWSDTYECGAALFWREFLSNSEWEAEACAHYGLTPEVVHLAIDIASRATVRAPVVELAEHEMKLLVPQDADYKGEALDLLISDGLFNISSE